MAQVAHALQPVRRHRSADRAAGPAPSRPAAGLRRPGGDDDRRRTGCSRSSSIPISSCCRASDPAARAGRRRGCCPSFRPIGCCCSSPWGWRSGSRAARLASDLPAVGGRRRHRFVLRLGTNEAISRGAYHVGSFYDFAWIAPWLCYAWAALRRRRRRSRRRRPDEQHESLRCLLVVPGAAHPARRLRRAQSRVGRRAGRLLPPVPDQPHDCRRPRARDAAACRAGQRTAARRRAPAAARRGDRAYRRPDPDHATGRDASSTPTPPSFARSATRARELVDAELRRSDRARHGPRAARHPGRGRGQRRLARDAARARRKDGSTFPAACTITALRDSAGRLTHFVGVERDITEDLALRDQLVHSERLSAIGELIAGVAHEINNPLQTIIGCTELMLDEPDGANRHDLELVRKEAMRAGQIVRNLLAFARRGASDRVADRPQRSGARDSRAARVSPAADQHRHRPQAARRSRCRWPSTARRSGRCSSTCCSTPSTRSTSKSGSSGTITVETSAGRRCRPSR